MIVGSASKLSAADLNNLMRALEIDVVALTEILVPLGHRVEMGMIDAPAIHYNLAGSGRISINRGPNMQLMPHLLIIVPPNTPFSIEVDGGDGATRLINRDCWKRDEEGLLRVAVPNEKPEVVLICGFFNASFGQSFCLFRDRDEQYREFLGRSADFEKEIGEE